MTLEVLEMGPHPIDTTAMGSNLAVAFRTTLCSGRIEPQCLFDCLGDPLAANLHLATFRIDRHRSLSQT
jgi:hypothetical protein